MASAAKSAEVEAAAAGGVLEVEGSRSMLLWEELGMASLMATSPRADSDSIAAVFSDAARRASSS